MSLAHVAVGVFLQSIQFLITPLPTRVDRVIFLHHMDYIQTVSHPFLGAPNATEIGIVSVKCSGDDSPGDCIVRAAQCPCFFLSAGGRIIMGANNGGCFNQADLDTLVCAIWVSTRGHMHSHS